jgi:hypothetical protein
MDPFALLEEAHQALWQRDCRGKIPNRKSVEERLLSGRNQNHGLHQPLPEKTP